MFRPETFEKVLLQYIQVRDTLKSLGVARNRKSIESQAGEWLVAKLYNGTIAENPNNTDWDVLADGRRIQVKTHAKSAANNNRHTDLGYADDAGIDDLVIIVFTEDLKLKHFFNISWQEAVRIRNNNDRIYWSALSEYDIPASELPCQETVRMFTGGLKSEKI